MKLLGILIQSDVTGIADLIVALLVIALIVYSIKKK